MTNSKKGKDWLKAKLKEGNRFWHEPQTTRFSFRHEVGRLRPPPNAPTDADALFGSLTEARNQIHASEAINILSVRIEARDMKHRGRLVETWLRGSLIRRIIERSKPNREGVSHDRYCILIGFLLSNGLVEPDRNGWRWQEKFRHMPARADWLIDLIRREGELRQVATPTRFVFLER